VPLVAIDSNVVDLFADCTPTIEHVEASESQRFPPDFDGDDPKMRRELFACYWLLSLGFWWRSTLYTFSDKLYAEVALASTAPSLLGLAIEVRENHPLEYRQANPSERPSTADVMALGVRAADAQHIADAIGMGCDVLLTNDRRLRKRALAIERIASLRLRLPSEFLVEAVRAGAPWPTSVLWPWEIIEHFVARHS
jgi:hypothetical protein